VVSSRWGCVAQIALAVAVTISLAMPGGSARGADPGAGLSEAESRAASAEAEIAAAQGEVDVARAKTSAVASRAVPASAAARAARDEARELRSTLLEREQQAKAEIAAGEAARQQEADDHDREVALGIGIGLAALLAAGIALAWGWFRATPPVAALSQINLGRALGLCLGGGLLLIVIGAMLGNAGGLPGAIGALLLGLGFVLPTALLLGRHSAEVQRGKAKPAFKRERLPAWLTRSIAALLLLIGLTSLGGSIFAEQPAAYSASTQLQEDSKALSQGPDAQRLQDTAAKADSAAQAASTPLAQLRSARASLRQANRALSRARGRLASAEVDERRFARRLAVLVAKEEREAAQAAARAAREAEELEEEESFSSGCDPNYTGCVPVYPPDVNCPEVGETVTVLGSDPHGLDADGDLVGCE